MKIRSLELNQFKMFDKPEYLGDIQDGLNVVIGPNEMGKSTLLCALRAVLFERHGSKAQAIREFANALNQAAPVVALTFEMDDGKYRIKKRFLKKPQAELQCPDGRRLEGDVAEDELRSILGFSTSGQGGANPETLGLWSILWVQQGESFGGFTMPRSAQSTLQDALEGQVGDVLGGAGAQKLPEIFKSQLSKLITDKTQAPKGDYKDALSRRDALNGELETLRHNEAELNEFLESLESYQNEVRELQFEAAQKAESEEVDQVRETLNKARDLKASLEAAETQDKVLELELSSAEQRFNEFVKLSRDIAESQDRVKDLDEHLLQVQDRAKELAEKLNERRQALKEAQQAAESAAKFESRQQEIVVLAHRGTEVKTCRERLLKARAAQNELKRLEQQLDAIPVTESAIQLIRKLDRRLSDAAGSLRAAATALTFETMFRDEPSRLEGVTLNDEPVQPGNLEFSLVENTSIRIPERGVIWVRPRIQGGDDLKLQHEQAKEDLAAKLRQIEAASIEEAESQWTRRQEFESQKKTENDRIELFTPATDRHASGVAALSEYVDGLCAERDRKAKFLNLTQVPEPDDAQAELGRLGEKKEQLALKAKIIRTEYEQVDSAWNSADAEVRIAQANLQNETRRLGQLKQQRTVSQSDRSEEPLRKGVQAAEQARDANRHQIATMQGKLNEFNVPLLEERIRRLESTRANRGHRIEMLNSEIAKLKGKLEVLESKGLSEAVRTAEHELNFCIAECTRYEHEVNVLRLLVDTFAQSERQAKEQYLAPVLNKVNPYLRHLIRDADAEIRIDENFSISTIQRSDVPEQFSHLSQGTQEQIAILVRIGFAELLAEQGYPSTVILDDALVYSDDDRIKLMFDILSKAAKSVQIIVLSCRKRLFQDLGAHHLTLRRTEDSDLQSA